MGRRISKEFLHPSILEGVNNKIGNLDSLETDAKGNMVQAINELVEKLDNSAEIENGKELIANAIGEPLTAEESFEEMRNDINGLLSTFKTNMMNNGVAVESGDKFKSLIDKIATMVEEGSNKGIKFASGTCDVTTNVGGSTTITTNLDFVPTYIFCYALVRRYRGQYNNVDGSLPNLYISNISSMPSTSGYPVSVSNITANDFRVSGGVYNSVEEYKTSVNVTKWYAIGIGEEDTTLRDSLADILENKGVDVTEEDDMASLITKVDSISGGLDIISATELPATGRENQICVITDNPVDNFVITPNNGYRPTDKIVLHTPDHNDNNCNYEYTISNVTYLLNITRVGLGNDSLASYYYSNGWQPLTYQYFPLMENGKIATNAIGKGLASGSDYLTYFSFVTGTEPYAYLYSGGTGIVFTRTTSKINFSIYNKITIRCRLSSAVSTKFWLGCFGDGVSNGDGDYSSSDFSPLCDYCTSTTINADTNEHILSFDISSWSGTYYLAFGKASNTAELHIYDILFYK